MAPALYYATLLRIRPAQLGDFVKRVLRIRRRIVTTNCGYRFDVDPVSVFGISLIRTSVYEPELSTLLRAILRPGDICVDLGGNEGYFSVLGAGAVGPGGRVHCI